MRMISSADSSIVGTLPEVYIPDTKYGVSYRMSTAKHLMRTGGNAVILQNNVAANGGAQGNRTATVRSAPRNT